MWLAAIVLYSIALEWFQRNRQACETDLVFKQTPDGSVISQTDLWTLVSLHGLKGSMCCRCLLFPGVKCIAMSDEGLPHTNEIDCDIWKHSHS